MRRQLISIAAFLLAGAVVNVAVTWACGIRVQETLRGPSKTEWFETLKQRSATELSGWEIQTNSQFGTVLAIAVHLGTQSSPEMIIPPRLLPNWSRIQELPAANAGEMKVWLEFAYGWPMVCVRGSLVRLTLGVGGATTDSAAMHAWRWRLPFRPIWPGFAINSVFYAAGLWLMYYGLHAVRRLIRRRRGLCPKCAYPVGESAVCTECGRELAT